MRAPLTLLLIRHGETEWNAQGRFRGHADINLSSRGLEQARTLGRGLPHAFSVAYVYSSPLKRCLDTARALREALHVPLIVEPLLIDLNFGEWQGKLPEEVASQYPREYEAWLQGDIYLQLPGGESLAAAAERLRSFLDSTTPRHAGEIVAVVTHEILCQLATCLLLGLPLSSFRRIRYDTASVSIFRRQEAELAVDGLNLPYYIPWEAWQ